MSDFVSRSQAGQDKWVYETLGPGGFFVDLGCNHPVLINNTYALEQVGWTGILVDTDDSCIRQCWTHRTSIALRADLTQPHEFWPTLPGHMDYLSLDVDESTLAALRHIPLDRIQFKLATIEHDSYRLGTEPRDAIRAIMHHHGYKIAFADVTHEGCAYEDWWYHPQFVSL